MSGREGICVEHAADCLLCGRGGSPVYQNLEDRLFKVPGQWSVVQCLECRIAWLNPRPSPGETPRLYEDYVTHHTNTLRVSRMRAARSWIGDAIVRSSLGYDDLPQKRGQVGAGRVLSVVPAIREMAERSVLTLGGSARGRLLDVGCGSGCFLAKMRGFGWEVTGIEPDPKAAHMAQRDFGVTVHVGTLEQAGLPEDTYHALTMHHVLEHLRSPLETLRECQRVLRPGGMLVVVTPNVLSLGHRLFRRAWFHLDPPRHYYLFSLAALRQCIEQAGFRVLSARTSPFTAGQTWRASRQIRKHGEVRERAGSSCPPWFRFEGLVFQAFEYAFRWLRPGAGEEIVLLARKHVPEQATRTVR